MKDLTEIVILFTFAALVFMLLCLPSCKMQTKIVTEYRDRVERDTLTRTDSVYVARYVREKGDTVYITDTLFRFRYLDKIREVLVRDSIPYTVEVQVPVRMRNGYDRFTSWGFWILLALVLLRVVWWVFKTFYLRKG